MPSCLYKLQASMIGCQGDSMNLSTHYHDSHSRQWQSFLQPPEKTMNLDVLCFGSVVPEVQLLYIYIIFIGCSQLALLSVSWMHNTRHQWSIFYHQLCQPQKLSPQFSSTSSSSKHWAMPLQWNASLFADEMSARQPENHKALEWSSDPKRKKQRSDVVSYDVCEPTNSKNNLFVDPRFHKHIRS